MKARLIIVSVIVIGALICMGVFHRHSVSPRVVRADDCQADPSLPTYDQWNQQIATPYDAPPERLQKIRRNYDRIAFGSSKDQVIEAFGPPSYVKALHPKTFRKTCYYDYAYFFRRRKKEENMYLDK